MPKVKILPDPPVDLLLAVMLERKQMKKISFDSLSRITGFTPEYLSNLFHRSPWDWPPETRRKICRALNVPEEYLTASAR